MTYTGTSPHVTFALTQRERDVLDRVAHGMTNVEIAEDLHVTVSTVKAHLSSVFTKLGVSNRTQAALTTWSREDLN